MAAFQEILHQEYERFRTLFGSGLLGVVEIGSFARGEAISYSDHDLRLIIRYTNPLFVLDEPKWTDETGVTTTPIEWAKLNQGDGMSFGLTNLEYVETILLAGRYPLIDHTCLYQGQVLIDETGAVETFRTRHIGVRFSNIVPDYLRQTEWRVANKLPQELSTLGERYDRRKYSLPVVHTCYRIVRDLANIANYVENGLYLGAGNDLENYYRKWPRFEPIFLKLRLYKTDERVRQAVFHEVVEGKSERISEIRSFAEATTNYWEQFRVRYSG